MNQKKYNRLIIYPSYSLRDYKTNTYLLDSDAEFNQMMAEIKLLKPYFKELYLIIPKDEQRELDFNRISNYVKTIEKKYQKNVGAERFMFDFKFFKSLDIGPNDILYTNFIHHWKLYGECGIPRENIMYTFQFFYPEYNPNHFQNLKNYVSINFHSKKALMKFKNDTGITENLYIINSDPGQYATKSVKYIHGKRPVLVIPARLDHEDFNHTWETLSIVLALKHDLTDLPFDLIICNSNNSANIGYLCNIANEIGPLTRKRFEDILSNEQGVILMLKESDYGGSKGAPEYLGSNLIFVSTDFKINPYNIPKNSGPQVYVLLKRLLSLKTLEYVRIKQEQKKICLEHHGKTNTTKIFENIFNNKEVI